MGILAADSFGASPMRIDRKLVRVYRFPAGVALRGAAATGTPVFYFSANRRLAGPRERLEGLQMVVFFRVGQIGLIN